MQTDGQYRRVQLEVTAVSKELGSVCFITQQPQPYLPLERDVTELMHSHNFVFCSFQLAFAATKIGKEFGPGLAAVPVRRICRLESFYCDIFL